MLTSFCMLLYTKVVLGTTLDEAAKNVMVHVRLPLLDPDVLSQLEKENQKKKYIPVSLLYNIGGIYNWSGGIPLRHVVSIYGLTLHYSSFLMIA